MTQTELRLVFKHPPRLGFGAAGDRRPEPNQLVVKLDPTTGIRLIVDAHRADAPGAGDDRARHGVRGRGRRGADAVRGAARTPRWSATARRFTRQDGVEETWRIMQPLLDAPPPVHPYAPGSWGPQAAETLVAGHGRWHEPWIAK